MWPLENAVVLFADYQSALQRLSSTSALTVGNHSPDVATSVNKTDAVKLAQRTMMRSFPYCTPWMMRLGRLHAFLDKHYTEYSKTCLAVRPPTMMNLSALDDDSATVSQPLNSVEYPGNQLMTVDGSIQCWNCQKLAGCVLFYWHTICTQCQSNSMNVIRGFKGVLPLIFEREKIL